MQSSSLRTLLPFLVVAIFIIPGLGAGIDLQSDERNVVANTPILSSVSRLNSETARTLSEALPDDEITIIVQFIAQLDRSDRDMMDDLGFRIHREYSAINGVALKGRVESVHALANEPNVRWIESDREIVFLMDESTTTINATNVWSTILVETNGKELPPIDGEGVTVVDLDTGIDAGHPDLDYGEKVIHNLKSDADGVYTEAENTDSGSGHGTHVAGTIAGNGDASGGARRGVAPGAKLIGISTGEALLTNVLGAMNWVFENSRANANPYNIRVVSNSWGSSGEYDPNNAVNVLTKRINYENNVVVVFAAGNEGSENHEGETVTTNPYALAPWVVNVAAIERDGSGVAVFSSRGITTENFTWPDVGAPGVRIWATEARKTMITAMRKQANDDRIDGYYMSISGTSMATPHISGLVALLWQACPSMRISEFRGEYTGTGTYINEGYWTDPETRMHEAEVILKLASRYIEPDALALYTDGDNGVPDNATRGVGEKRNDYAQGYGLVDARDAVGIALILQELRNTDASATVMDAYEAYHGAKKCQEADEQNGIWKRSVAEEETNVLKASWTGEWSRLNDKDNFLVTDHPRQVYIPNATEKLILDVSFSAVDATEKQVGDITITIDTNGDGSDDWTGTRFSANGQKHDEIDLRGAFDADKGKLWHFNVDGFVAGAPGTVIPGGGIGPDPLGNDFIEQMIEYEISVQLVLGVSENESTMVDFYDRHSSIAQLEFGVPTLDYMGGTITILAEYYDLHLMGTGTDETDVGEDTGSSLWPILLIVIILLIVLSYLFFKKRELIPFLPGSKSVAKIKEVKEIEDDGDGGKEVEVERVETDDVGEVKKEDLKTSEASKEDMAA